MFLILYIIFLSYHTNLTVSEVFMSKYYFNYWVYGIFEGIDIRKEFL